MIDWTKPVAGYQPIEVGKDLVQTCLTFGMTTVIARFFFPEIEAKRHLIFGQVQAISLVLLWDNRKLREWRDKAERDPKWKTLVHAAYFITFIIAPIILAKSIAQIRRTKKLPWKQTFKWGMSSGAMALTILGLTGAFQNHQKKQETQ